MDVTQDKFLGGRIVIAQPKDGYRAATDPVFLAACVNAKSGERILDVGCGVGVASLCLLARVPDVLVTGLELQESYANLARDNAQRNGLSLEIVAGDLSKLPAGISGESFDQIITNPPYFKSASGTAPRNAQKAQANIETLDLMTWIDICLRRLRPTGIITIIHLAERLDEILEALNKKCGDISVLPLSSREGQPANRVIVRAKKSSKAPLRLMAPFVVHAGDAHGKDGKNFSERAQKILEERAPLIFD